MRAIHFCAFLIASGCAASPPSTATGPVGSTAPTLSVTPLSDRGDMGRSGVFPHEGPSSATPVAVSDLEIARGSRGERFTPLVLSAGRLWVTDYDAGWCQVSVLGSEVALEWCQPEGFAGQQWYRRGLVALDDVVIGLFESGDTYQLVTLERSTGAVRWRIDLEGSERPSGLSSADGVVVANVAFDSTLMAWSTEDGAPLWTAVVDAVRTHPPAIADGVVVTGTVLGDDVLAFDLQTGAELWRAQFSGFIGAPVAGDGRVFAATDGSLGAWDIATGAELWTTDIPTSSSDPLIRWSDRVVARDGSGQLTACDAATGTELATVDPGYAFPLHASESFLWYDSGFGLEAYDTDLVRTPSADVQVASESGVVALGDGVVVHLTDRAGPYECGDLGPSDCDPYTPVDITLYE